MISIGFHSFNREKELKKLNRTKKRNILVIVSILSLALFIIFLYQSFAYYETDGTSRAIDSKVVAFYDIKIYLDNVEKPSLPSSTSSEFVNSVCEEGEISWNDDSWQYELPYEGLSKCSLYFRTVTTTFKYYLNNVLQASPPSKASNTFSAINCSLGSAYWDVNSWNYVKTTTKGSTDCSVYFTSNTITVKYYVNNQLQTSVPLASETNYVSNSCSLGSITWNSSTWNYTITTSYGSTNCNLYFAIKTTDFTYNGTDRKNATGQQYTVPLTGKYRIELWGARPHGAYVAGDITLTKGEILYFFVGDEAATSCATSAGNCYNSQAASVAAWNGGSLGSTYSPYRSGGGGGSTDVRLVNNGSWNDAYSLNSRIMVAASSSSGPDPSGVYASRAGGLVGKAGYNGGAGAASAGTQVGPRKTVTSYSKGTDGTMGSGGYNRNEGQGGGGGYFGGNGGKGGTASSSSNHNGGGGGGSSYISGHLGAIARLSLTSNEERKTSNGTTTCTAANAVTDIVCSYHYSGKYFTNTTMISGAGKIWTTVEGAFSLMPNPYGGTFIEGSGNNSYPGYARISFVS